MWVSEWVDQPAICTEGDKQIAGSGTTELMVDVVIQFFEKKTLHTWYEKKILLDCKLVLDELRRIGTILTEGDKWRNNTNSDC